MARNEVATRIIDSLAFEVEAVPQDNILEVSGTSKSTPLNLKIKVRKKEEALFKQGVVSVPKLAQPKKSPDKIRLVSSDQTVLSFKVFVDTDPEKKPAKKRKRFFGGCLSSEDNDDDVYVESSDVTNPGEVVKLNFGLSKNVEDMQIQTRKPIMFFGNTCKPGGCLDPPYGEDRYSYGPKQYIDIIPTENDIKLSNAVTTETISITESLDKTTNNDKIKNDLIKTSAPRDFISTGGISTGGISTGRISTGGISAGGISDGGISADGISVGGIRSGGISSTGGVNTGKVSTGGIDTGGTTTGGINTGKISTGRISTAQIGKRNSNQKRSIQSMDVKPSFRDLSDLSHFSLVKEKKRLTQTENISEVSTSDDEMVVTKLYPKENDRSFKSETNSATQDLKGNEENLTTTILGVGGAITVPVLIAGAVQEVTRSREDTIHANNEKGLTSPISTKENKMILRSGDDNDNSYGTLIHPETEEVQNSSEKLDNVFQNSMSEEYYKDLKTVEEKIKLNKSDEISSNKGPRNLQVSPDILIYDNEACDQKFGSGEDENIVQSVKGESINNLSDVNENSTDENNVDRKLSNEIETNIDDSTQEAKIHDAFQINGEVENLMKEIRNKNNTELKSNDQPVDELDSNAYRNKNKESQKPEDLIKRNKGKQIKNLPEKFGIDNKNLHQISELQDPKDLYNTSDGVGINNNPESFGKENEKILDSQQSKSSGVDTNDTNNTDFCKIQDPNKLTNPIEKTLSSSVHDNKNLKVDFINDNTPVMNDDINKLKDKDQATDSILNSRDGSKFRVKKDFINMNLAFQSYTNDQNESVIKSLDNINDIKREPQDNVTIIKSQLRIDAQDVIKVPIDTRNYMMLEVRASDHQMPSLTSSQTPEGADSRVSDEPASAANLGAISTGSKKSSSILDDVAKNFDNKGKFPTVPSQGSQKNDVDSFQNLLSTVYDHQLIPLRRLISDLKTDVDKLASEQLWLKENCRRMRRPAKLTHSSRKCGCSRKLS